MDSAYERLKDCCRLDLGVRGFIRAHELCRLRGRREVVRVRRAVRVKVEVAICEAFHMGVLIAAGIAMKAKLRSQGTAKIYLFFL